MDLGRKAAAVSAALAAVKHRGAAITLTADGEAATRKLLQVRRHRHLNLPFG